MIRRRRAVSLLGAGLMAVVGMVACGDFVTDPTLAPEEARLDREKKVELRALERSEPALWEESGWAYIGPAGGALRVAGVELRVPEGALDSEELIYLVVPAGDYVQAELFPHGLQFDRAVELEFSLRGTVAEDDRTAAAGLVGVYFEGEIRRGGWVEAEELVGTELWSGSIVLQIHHFSGYTPAGG